MIWYCCEIILWVLLLQQLCVVLSFASAIEKQLTVAQIIKKHGYPIETFENIATEDKYLITLFRIPHGRNNTKQSRKPAVLLMHGIIRTSYDYVILGPGKSLAFILADRGYDVWLGNARGTIYSKKHMELNSNHPKYWDFSFHEVGVYDLPAYIDKIKNVTGQKKISYVGYSQGTAVFYVLASQRPKYNDDISVMVALAPISYLKHLASPIVTFAAKQEELLKVKVISKMTGVYELPPAPLTNWLNGIIRQICRPEHEYFLVCTAIIFMIVGNNPEQFNKADFHKYIGDGISPVSMRQFVHFVQLTKSNDFTQYNFDKATNLKVYGAAVPPAYNISKITTPVALFYSEGDILAQPKDAERLSEKLPNCIHKYKMPMERFNHFDFMFAIDVVPLLYENVLQILDQNNKIGITN